MTGLWRADGLIRILRPLPDDEFLNLARRCLGQIPKRDKARTLEMRQPLAAEVDEFGRRRGSPLFQFDEGGGRFAQ